MQQVLRFTRDTFATFVALVSDGGVVTGQTFTIGHAANDTLAFVAGFGPLPTRLARNIVLGKVLVCTPHAIGAYAERADGGVYANVPAKALKRAKTLQAALKNDPRVPTSMAGVDLYAECVERFQQ